MKNLTKRFEKVTAVDNLSLTVPTGAVMGLVGSNGSGKSTMLRLLAGVFRADGGSIALDGRELFDNAAVKGECFFVPDFPFFYNNSTVENTAALYRELYPNWSEDAYARSCAVFPIDPKGRLIDMSKGMGLDPVMRHMLKKILIEHVSEQQMTVVIASHNLRELEDLCDRVCLMHCGRVLLERDIDSLRRDFRKVQVAFREVPQVPNLFEGINVVSAWRNGNVFNVTIRGAEEEFMPKLNALRPAYISAMPLTLEEIFISEMGAAGYDANTVR